MLSAVHRLLSLLILFQCIFIGSLKAQKTDFKFEQLTINEGLSSNRVWCIYRDREEFLWICTDVGLDRYDSKNVISYRYNEDDSTSISSNSVRYIFEDQNGTLWFGTNKGLNLYNRKFNNFKRFSHVPGDSSSLNGNFVNSIIEDYSGVVWVLTNGNCLNEWHPETQSFQRYIFSDDNPNVYAPHLNMMALDSDGNIWLAKYKNGLVRFDPGAKKFTELKDPDIDFGHPVFKGLFIDKNDKIWIGSDGNGFFSFDIRTRVFRKYPVSTDGKGVNQSIILDIFEENSRYLLLAVDQGGINRFDKIKEEFEYLKFSEDQNTTGLNNNGIWCFHKDKEGILWVGTSGGGVNYYNPKKSKFKLFRKEENNRNSLSYNFTGCFFEDHLGHIWIGTDGGGLNVYDPENQTFKVFKHDPSNPKSISGNVIRSIAEDKNHNLWIGTWDTGLNCYERETGLFHRYFPDSNDPTSISGRTIWNLRIDHNGLLWMSVYNIGIDVFHIEKGVIKKFSLDDKAENSLSSNAISFIYEDDQYNIWCSTEDGLNLYDPVNDSFIVYRDFPDNNLNIFFKDSKGRYWVGTSEAGIIQFDLTGEIKKIYDTGKGLPNNNVKAITEDNSGNLWISTNKGLAQFNPEKEVFINYDRSDGLQGDQFFLQSFLKTKKGELYFGGFDGFNSFYPDSLTKNEFIPPVYINDFRLFNRSLSYADKDSPLKYTIKETREIKMSWQNSVISFDFIAINYTYPEKNEYKYILKGFESSWNFTDASRTYVTYTNLDPGEYHFKVVASNNDGVWNEEGTSLKLIITPPFWKIWWFKVTATVCMLLMVYLAYLFRTSQLRKTNMILERKVNLRTDQLKRFISELQENKDELEATNEELVSTMDELSEQKQYVEEINIKLKKAHDELCKINEQLDERVKDRTYKLSKVNKELDRLVYSASHDLIAPLKSLLGLIHITKIEITDGPVVKNVEHMEKSVKKLERVITSLGHFALNMDQNINIEDIRFGHIVDEVICGLGEDYNLDKVTIIRNYSSDDFIETDVGRLKIVLKNLILNAIQFNRDRALIEIKFVEKRRSYQIEVKDNGIGIERKNFDKIFLMFYRGTELSQGSGMGLYIVKEILEKLKGRIYVDSEPNQYSRFKIRLPK